MANSGDLVSTFDFLGALSITVPCLDGSGILSEILSTREGLGFEVFLTGSLIAVFFL